MMLIKSKSAGVKILIEGINSFNGLTFIIEVIKNKAITGAIISLCKGITNAKMSKV